MKTTTFLAALLACCVVVLLPTRPYAQQSVDFATALELARKNNPDWRAAAQELEIARGKLTTARLISPFNPVIEGQGWPPAGFPGKEPARIMAWVLSMELEVAGQRGLRIGEAEQNLQRAEAGFQDFARTFRGRLARAFLSGCGRPRAISSAKKDRGVKQKSSGRHQGEVRCRRCFGA